MPDKKSDRITTMGSALVMLYFHYKKSSSKAATDCLGEIPIKVRCREVSNCK